MVGEISRLPRWSTADGKVVLVGDACHAIPPFSGAGTGQGIEDAVVLAALLAHASSGEDLGKLCHVYYGLRNSRVEKVRELTYPVGRALSMANGPEQIKRDRFLRMGVKKQREIDPEYADPFEDVSVHIWLDEFDVVKEVSRITLATTRFAGDGR